MLRKVEGTVLAAFTAHLEVIGLVSFSYFVLDEKVKVSIYSNQTVLFKKEVNPFSYDPVKLYRIVHIFTVRQRSDQPVSCI